MTLAEAEQAVLDELDVLLRHALQHFWGLLLGNPTQLGFHQFGKILVVPSAKPGNFSTTRQQCDFEPTSCEPRFGFV